MFERLKWPGAALLLGGIGALIRRWQLAAAYDEATGLYQPFSPVSLAMLLYLVAAGAALLLLAARTPGRLREEGRLSGWDRLFAGEKNGLYLVMMVLAALLTLCSAPLLLQEAARLRAVQAATGGVMGGLLQTVLALCAAAACGALLVSARHSYRMLGRGREYGLLLVPVLMCCVWLLDSYRANAPDPALWNYAPLLLAAGLDALFYLACAGLSFEQGHPRRMLWLAAMSVTASAVALAGLPGKAMGLLLGGQMLAALAALWLVPGNFACPPGPDRFGLRARLRQGLPLEEEKKAAEGGPENGQPDAQEIQEEDHHA